MGRAIRVAPTRLVRCAVTIGGWARWRNHPGALTGPKPRVSVPTQPRPLNQEM